MKVIIDFDGTLTAEEEQALPLAELSLTTLAQEIIHAPREQLAADYQATRARLLREPQRYHWDVNGLIASYCDEGAFILNTTTIQTMIKEQPDYLAAVETFFTDIEYDPAADCSNYLFHRHTAELPPQFRPDARATLAALADHPQIQPIILTNSLGDKVERHLATLNLDRPIAVLGDTRQYDMDPTWQHHFPHPTLGPIQIWPVLPDYPIDLRRPAYHRALLKEAAGNSQLVVVADTFSLPGALPLLMGIPFFLLRTDYTPGWCVQVVESHPLGHLLETIGDLPAALERLLA